jgi:hypothetical protein
MRIPKIALLPVFFLIVINNCFAQEKWQPLFNGKDLTGWDTYIGPAFDSLGKQRNDIPVLGLNNDSLKVFSVVSKDGKPALRISGERFGGISIQKELANYHLRLEFRWGELKWHPRKNQKRDSGILYHAVGEHGADWGFWMRSQEFQVQEGDCGDYWGVAGGSFDIPAIKFDEGKYRYDPSGSLLSFREGSSQGRRCFKYPDAEKPTGEWNILEVYCFDDTAVHVVNGKVVMVLFHSGQSSNGTLSPLKKGKLQIQSEGAEVFYRNIEVRSIKKIPAEILGGK